eukprot:3623639-Amphidinium_carterae.1
MQLARHLLIRPGIVTEAAEGGQLALLMPSKPRDCRSSSKEVLFFVRVMFRFARCKRVLKDSMKNDAEQGTVVR